MIEDLKKEGDTFLAEAFKICQPCEHKVMIDGTLRCSFCCCPLFYKIKDGILEKSACPKNKW